MRTIVVVGRDETLAIRQFPFADCSLETIRHD